MSSIVDSSPSTFVKFKVQRKAEIQVGIRYILILET